MVNAGWQMRNGNDRWRTRDGKCEMANMPKWQMKNGKWKMVNLLRFP